MCLIGDKFFENVILNPHEVAVWCDGDSITYSELDKLVNRFSNLLINRGVRYEDHIGVLLPNSINFVALMLAASNLGVAIVPLCDTLPIDVINKLFKASDVKHVIGNVNIINQMSKEEFYFIEGLWLSMDGYSSRSENFQELINTMSCKRVTLGEVKGYDKYIITLTSGSTGNPKPIVLSQKNKYDRVKAAIDLYDVTKSDNVLAATPLYHSLAERLVLIPLMLGGTSILLSRFSPSLWMDVVREQKVSFSIAVSSQLKQISELLSVSENRDICSLRCIVSSSALLEKTIKEKLCLRLNCDLHECYGTSEVGIVSNLNMVDSKIKLSSVGKNIQDVDIKILTNCNKFAEVGEIGEIVCKTPMLFSGYYKLPEVSENSIFKEYFKTGDIGYIDKDGFLYYLDREKDIIITGGINVYPSDIERIVLQLSWIKECAAFSLFDEQLGEIVCVAVTLKEHESFKKREIRFHCAKYLADFQQPRRYFLLDEMPKNNMGKLVKHKLVDICSKL